MLKLLTIIGARPQIIKAAALSRAIRDHFADTINEVILHTGQHYDNNMSRGFFKEMEIPEPDYNLHVGSDSHGKQTAQMIIGIEDILLKENPDYLILYGDTNSTLAGAVAGAKLHVPVVHIEAGLRSHNKNMPEEINRITCDHVSTLLFSPTKTGYNNLISEGFNEDTKSPFTIDNPRIYHCGDVMFDNTMFFSGKAEKRSKILRILHVKPLNYVLCTIHRDNNTDDPVRLNALFNSIYNIAGEHDIPIILPLHPRTKKILRQNLSGKLYNSIINHPNINIIKPVSFLDMIILEKNSSLIMTDSGGVQKEAYFFQKPCIILRSETEWKEIVENRTAIVADANKKNITGAYKELTNRKNLHFPPIFGDGNAAMFICKELIRNRI